MAENTAIATQTELGALNFAIQQATENLAAHVNGSLSEAHGIGMYPGLADDGAGNDLTYYRDSNDDIVGYVYVRIVMNGVPYYVPAVVTTLAAKPATTGIADTDLSTYGIATGPGGSHWVTQFDLDVAQYIQEVLDTYLLPHVQKGYWEAHGNFSTPIPSIKVDSAGHTVGDTLLPIPVHGNYWDILGNLRFGGPLQGLVMGPFSPVDVYYDLPAGSSDNFSTTITPVYLRGTKPVTYSYEYYYAGWHALPSGSAPVYVNSGNGAGTAVTYNSTDGILFQLDCGGPGGDNYDEIWLRLTATNPAGSTHADYLGSDLIFKIKVQDHASGCWFATQCETTLKLSAEQWTIMGEIEKWLYVYNRRYCAWYVRHGKGLVEQMLAQGVTQKWFEDFISQITRIYPSQPRHARMLYVKTVIEMILKYWPQGTRVCCLHLNKLGIPQ